MRPTLDCPSLYGADGVRKYLTSVKRQRFIVCARATIPPLRLLCLVLAFSGARLSEVLALTPAAIDLDTGVVTLRTLKRRKPGIVRQVPLPDWLLIDLDRSFDLRVSQRDPARSHKRIWNWIRTKAWRVVKFVMAGAEVRGAHATPKGLRHAFGVCAFQSNVPPHLVQRWLGHASLRTTAIYGDVIGPEEREIAARMWRSKRQTV